MPYQQVSLAQLKVALADRYEGVPFWTPTEATRGLNEGLRIWNAATGFWRAPFDTNTVPNDPYVALPGTLTQASRVLWNGIALEKADKASFDYGIPNWRAATASQPLYWAPVSLSLLVLYPADSSIPPNSLRVDGVRDTPVLTTDGQLIDLGREEHDLLLGYAQHVLAFKLGGEKLAASYPGWLAFLKGAGERNRQFAASVYYRRALGLDQFRKAAPPVVAVTTSIDELGQQAQDQQVQG